MPRVRQEAAAMVRKGFTPTEVGRRFGVGSSTVCKWVKKSRVYGYHPIPTRSSRPRHHPNELCGDITDKIVEIRLRRRQCAEVVHKILAVEGTVTSLSSVKRTLDRRYLTKKRSPWKRWHHCAPRPEAAELGALVQLDTVHLMVNAKKRIYVFTLIDVCSRFAYAKAFTTVRAGNALLFVKEAQRNAPFLFEHLQTDHGPEFGKYFVRQVKIRHRHSRVRRPNDNAHIERFNRTVQEQCLDALPRDVRSINKALPKFLAWYNNARPHLGISLQTPMQLINNRVQAID